MIHEIIEGTGSRVVSYVICVISVPNVLRNDSVYDRDEHGKSYKPLFRKCKDSYTTIVYSPPKVDNIWLWASYNKIPINPIFYLGGL